MRGSWLWCRGAALVLIGAAFAAPVAAQQPDSLVDQVQLAQLNLDSLKPDTIVLTLHRHGQYRITVSPPTVQVRVISAGTESFLVPTRNAVEGQPQVYELYPQNDGQHLVILTAPPNGERGNATITEDLRAERVIRGRAAEHWRIGLAVAGGLVTGYQQGGMQIGDSAIVPSTDKPGISRFVEAGVLLRSNARLSFELGYGYDPRPPQFTSVDWSFVELLWRMHVWHVKGHDLALHAAVRYIQSVSSGYVDDRDAVGVGLLWEWRLSSAESPTGFRLTFQPQLTAREYLQGQSPLVGRAAVGLSWIP